MYWIVLLSPKPFVLGTLIGSIASIRELGLHTTKDFAILADFDIDHAWTERRVFGDLFFHVIARLLAGDPF